MLAGLDLELTLPNEGRTVITSVYCLHLQWDYPRHPWEN